MGDFNHPDTRWKDTTARLVPPRRFLECFDDTFLTQVIKAQRQRGSQLDLVLEKQGRPVEELNVGDRLGCQDCEMGGVQGHEKREKTNSRIMALACQRAGFGLLRDLLGMGDSPGEKRASGELVDFQGSRLQAQEQCMPPKGKSSRCCRRPAWMRKRPDKAQILKGSIQKVKARASDPGEIQRCCLSMEGWD